MTYAYHPRNGAIIHQFEMPSIDNIRMASSLGIQRQRTKTRKFEGMFESFVDNVRIHIYKGRQRSQVESAESETD